MTFRKADLLLPTPMLLPQRGSSAIVVVGHRRLHGMDQEWLRDFRRRPRVRAYPHPRPVALPVRLDLFRSPASATTTPPPPSLVVVITGERVRSVLVPLRAVVQAE